MKAFIIMANRLTWPKAMCEYLSDTGCEVVLIDNNSTYPPLLKWYETCPYTVERMDKNWGHQVLWKSPLWEKYTDEYYIVTDHDLDLSTVPTDYKEVLREGLDSTPSVVKAGFSLKLDDLPDNPFTKKVIDWESKFWKSPRKGNFFFSDIDTTFAMYDRKRPLGELPNNTFFRAIRADKPYEVRHMPWYLTKEAIEESEEESYYQNTAHTYWSQIFKEIML